MPQASVAINVLTTVYSLAQAPGVVHQCMVILNRTAGIAAVGVPNEGVSGHSMVAAAGTEVNTGAVLSVTVIACDAVAVLPQASVAINVLTTVYSLAQVPGVVASVLVILKPHRRHPMLLAYQMKESAGTRWLLLQVLQVILELYYQ